MQACFIVTWFITQEERQINFIWRNIFDESRNCSQQLFRETGSGILHVAQKEVISGMALCEKLCTMTRMWVCSKKRYKFLAIWKLNKNKRCRFLRSRCQSGCFPVSSNFIGWRLVLTYMGWRAPEMQALRYLKVTWARQPTRLALSLLCLVNCLNTVVSRQTLGPLIVIGWRSGETLRAKAATFSWILNWICGPEQRRRKAAIVWNQN